MAAKPKTTGTVVVLLRSKRHLGSTIDGCQGTMAYGEVLADDDPDPYASTRRLNAPTAFDLIDRALGENPEFGSVVKVTVTVEVVAAGKPDRKACHNPWPAHSCNIRKRAGRG